MSSRKKALTPAMAAMLRRAAADADSEVETCSKAEGKTARALHRAGFAVFSDFGASDVAYRNGASASLRATPQGLSAIRELDGRHRPSTVERAEARQFLTPTFLREALDYDPTTGAVVWKVRPDDHFISAAGAAKWNGKFPGKAVGARTKSGHAARVRLAGVDWHLTHILWFMVHGEWPVPPDEIVCVNGDNWDMRLDNLRRQPHQTTMRVALPRSPRGRSGISGVHYDKHTTKWRASINDSGNPSGIKVLGYFPSKTAAAAARAEAAQRLGYSA